MGVEPSGNEASVLQVVEQAMRIRMAWGLPDALGQSCGQSERRVDSGCRPVGCSDQQCFRYEYEGRHSHSRGLVGANPTPAAGPSGP